MENNYAKSGTIKDNKNKKNRIEPTDSKLTMQFRGNNQHRIQNGTQKRNRTE